MTTDITDQLPTITSDSGEPLTFRGEIDITLFRARLKIWEEGREDKAWVFAYFERANLHQPWSFDGWTEYRSRCFHAAAALAAWASAELKRIGEALPPAWTPAHGNDYEIQPGDVVCNSGQMLAKILSRTRTRCRTARMSFQGHARGHLVGQTRESNESQGRWTVYPAHLNHHHAATIAAIP